MSDKPIALVAYEELAEAYAEKVDEKPHNAYYERPATLELLPEVQGRAVLDAGCGPGFYSEWLVQQGAAPVWAVDVSSKMVELARERVGSGADIRRADLEDGLGFLEDSSLDLVVSSLALTYIEEVEPVFREFGRVLEPDGILVFSTEHPFNEIATYEPENYFEVEAVSYPWTGFGPTVEVPSYRRPLSAWTEALAEAGFVIERLVEPRPTEAFRAADPEGHAKLSRRPGFMCIRARTA